MKESALTKLTALMERLRGPKGCPWDREQTLSSLIPFIIEEAYEVAGAIESGSLEDIREECGDLLFQIIFICRIAGEKGAFGIEDVMEESAAKMIRRHPHVFGGKKAETTEEAVGHWTDIKKKEKKTCVTGVPEIFPSLIRAHKISEKAAIAGFDWKDAEEVLEKVEEELEEFKSALSSKDPDRTEEELGDLLFTLVNLSRFVEVNPEEALRKTIGKFIRRFHYVEKKLMEEGKELSCAGMEEMEKLWNEAKSKEKKGFFPGS